MISNIFVWITLMRGHLQIDILRHSEVVMYHSQIWIREIDIFIPVRKTFITHIDNIGIPKHETHLRLLSSGMKLFLLPLSWKVSWHKERSTIFLCWLFHLHPQHVWHPPQGHCELAKVTLLLWTNWLSSKSSAHTSGAWRHSHPQVTIFYLGFLFWHLWATHPPRERVNTCAQVCT